MKSKQQHVCSPLSALLIFAGAALAAGGCAPPVQDIPWPPLGSVGGAPVANSGGATGSGGASSSGGAPGSGGAPASSGGAPANSGGAVGSGGARSGGATGSGGASSTGGAPASGGMTGGGGRGGSAASTGGRGGSSTGGAPGGGGSSGGFAAVATILGTSCGTGTCHQGGAHVDLRNNAGLYARIVGAMPTGTNTMAMCRTRTLVVAGDPAMSVISQVIKAAVNGCAARMPDECSTTGTNPRACLTAAQITTIDSWIMGGALQ